MADKVSVTGKIRVTLEIDWPHTFGEGAQAKDIYITAQKECRNILERALEDNKIRHRIIGDVETLMVILPVKKS